MAFPMAGTSITIRLPAVTARKEATLDQLLPPLIALRIVVEAGIHDPNKKQAVCDAVHPIIVRDINPKILEVIFSEDPTYFHTSPPPKNWQKALKNVDGIESSVRSLIRFAYDDDIGEDVVRKKVTGCVNVILTTVNTARFFDELRASPAGEHIKPIRIRRDYTRNIYN